MRNFIEMDSTPLEEECVNAGNSTAMQQLEVKAMIDMIQRTFDPWPDGFYLKRNKNYHEFGIYYDIQLCYEEGDIESHSHSEEFTFFLEENWPERWDEEARGFLTDHGYFEYLKSQEKPQVSQFAH